MKMASVSVVSVFLLCCSAIASQDCNRFAPTGGSFNVPLEYQLQPTDTLKWKFNGKLIFHKRPEKVITGKTDDITKDGSLKLTNLKKDQDGDYIPEIFDQSGQSKNTKTTKLCVQDPVKKPKISATCKDANVKFECNPGQQPQDAKYEWLRNGAKIKENSLPFEMKTTETKSDKFICKVFNNVSSETSEPVTHNCAQTGIPGLPDTLLGISIWYFIGGGGGIVLVLIIIVIVCCIRTNRRRKLLLMDEEELRLEWTNTEQHNHRPYHPPLPDHPPPHHPHRHHHHQQQQQQQQQAPGNTGPRQSRSKQNRQPRARAPEPNSQPQPSPRQTIQAQKPANDDDEQPPPLPQPRKKAPKAQVD